MHRDLNEFYVWVVVDLNEFTCVCVYVCMRVCASVMKLDQFGESGLTGDAPGQWACVNFSVLACPLSQLGGPIAGLSQTSLGPISHHGDA